MAKEENAAAKTADKNTTNATNAENTPGAQGAEAKQESKPASSNAAKQAELSNLQVLLEKLMELNTSDELNGIKLQILKRLASESEVKPARIQAPLNITQIGGYINLLRKLDKQEQTRLESQRTVYQEMLQKALTSILGLPVQTP